MNANPYAGFHQPAPTNEDIYRQQFRRALAIVLVAVLIVLGAVWAFSAIAGDDAPATETTTSTALADYEQDFVAATAPFIENPYVTPKQLLDVGYLVADYIEKYDATVPQAAAWLYASAVNTDRDDIIDREASQAIARNAYYYLMVPATP